MPVLAKVRTLICEGEYETVFIVKLKTSLLFSLAALFLACPIASGQAPASPTAGGEKTSLRPRFIPGKTYRFVSTTAIQMTLASRPDQTSEIVLEQGAKLIVNHRPSGEPGVFITASTEVIKLKLVAGQNKIDFDSSQENAMETPIGKHFQNSLTRWTQIEVSPQGKLLARRDGGGVGEASPMPQLPEIGASELQQLIASLMSNFPAQPVAKDSEWVHKGNTKLGQFGEMNFEIANRYIGDQLVDGAACAVVAFNGTIKGDVKLEGAGAADKLGFEGNKMSGRFFFDTQAGITRYSEQVVAMDIENAQLPKTSVEQQIQMRLLSMEDTEG